MMTPLIRPFAPEEAIGVLAIFCLTAVAIVALVNRHKRQSQRDDMEATLKMEMISRGMSAGDIKQVLESRMGVSKGSLFVNLENAGAGLVRQTVEHALDLEEMVKERKAKRVS
jgi:hypothetical protein